MKSQVNASRQRSCFSTRSLSRFSPTSSTPASASAPISALGTYLQATRISVPVGTSARTAARLSATRPGSMSRNGSTITTP